MSYSTLSKYCKIQFKDKLLIDKVFNVEVVHKINQKRSILENKLERISIKLDYHET